MLVRIRSSIGGQSAPAPGVAGRKTGAASYLTVSDCSGSASGTPTFASITSGAAEEVRRLKTGSFCAAGRE